MKKILFLLCLLITLSSSSYAASTDMVNNSTVVECQNKIDNIGFKILNSNGIEKRMIFNYDTSKTKNAFSESRYREIVLYRGLYNRLASDDEIAAVLAHEISHGVDSYEGIFKGYFSSLKYAFSPKKYEYKADKRGVDYMVNAGYNPVAMIVVFNKALNQGRYDWYSSHPLTSRRMAEIYEYIYKKYPEYLVNNKYKDNPFYQNFLLTSKENRVKFQEKIKTNSKKAVKYK